jgi:hypothetical protein
MQQSQLPRSSLTVAEAGAENAGAVAGVPEVEVNDGREDLTVFFSIGVVVDVLLVTAFLVWAVGQWRKKK